MYAGRRPRPESTLPTRACPLPRRGWSLGQAHGPGVPGPGHYFACALAPRAGTPQTSEDAGVQGLARPDRPVNGWWAMALHVWCLVCAGRTRGHGFLQRGMVRGTRRRCAGPLNSLSFPGVASLWLPDPTSPLVTRADPGTVVPSHSTACQAKSTPGCWQKKRPRPHRDKGAHGVGHLLTPESPERSAFTAMPAERSPSKRPSEG